MELGLAGRRAIVTGGSKGLGYAIAEELIREGARVAICSRNEAEVVAAGEALAFARGLGEFGATIMFAGSLQKVTQTLPLAIYAEFEVNFDVTLAISALLVLISAAVLISLKLTSLWQPSEQISPSRFARLSWS